MADSAQGESRDIARRHLLQGLAGGGTILAAGCIGEDPEGGNGENGGNGGNGENSGQTFTLTDIYAPQDLQFNWLNPSDSGAEDNSPGELLYDRFLLYTPVTDEYHTESFIINDWTSDGDTLTIEISDEHTWHDGDDVTADDVVAHWRLDMYSYEASGSEHPYISDLEAVDDTTVEFNLHEEFNEEVTMQYLFTGEDDRLYTKESLYSEWLEDLENAESEDELQEIFGELQREAFDEPVGNGPFEYTGASEQSMTLELFEDYPTADDINFSSVEWRAFSDGQSELQAIQAGEIDAALNISPQEESIMEQWPAGLDTPRIDMPDFGGNTLNFQHEHEVLGITEVRQAFAHVINRDNIATNTPENLQADDVMAFVGSDVADEWLGDLTDDLNSYETDEERAAELMEEAGFERDGGDWVDDDGEQISITIQTPPWADTWVPVAQTASDNLSEFGIQAEMLSQDASAWSSDLNDGNYDMIVDSWGGSPHPYFELEDLFAGVRADSIDMPEEVEVPSVGDADGSTETINVVEAVRGMPSQEEEQMRESVQQLAWIVNQYLPVLPVSSTSGTSWLFTPDEWEYTTDDDGLMSTSHPPMFGPRMGFLRAKTDDE